MNYFDTGTPFSMLCASYFAYIFIALEFARIGLGICYDVRFPELAMVAARLGISCLLVALYARLTGIGCHMCIYPSAFNTTTGPLHWELLQRARLVYFSLTWWTALLIESFCAVRWIIKSSFQCAALLGIWTQVTMQCVTRV
jgi:hypothetical protein